MINIHSLMTRPRPGNTALAIHQGEKVLWSSFYPSVQSLTHALSQRSEHRFGLFCESSYAFAIGFFALLHSRKIPILLPHIQRGALKEWQGSIDALITDLCVEDCPFPIFNPIQSTSFPEFDFQELDPKHSQLELFTSGSTGDRKVIRKNLIHLEEELEVLEETWGARINDCHVLATVSHQHIYGLLFRVLWPLTCGRSFSDKTLFLPELFYAELGQNEKNCLVSSPAFLKRLPQLMDLKDLSSFCSDIFSSGGLLEESVSRIFLSTRKTAPIEVFGSTETGGVAWRQQREGQVNAAWIPLKGVKLKTQGLDHVLWVKSPFIFPEHNQEWLEMGDCATIFPNGSFELKGRKDRIVKVEEKRLSLYEMERHLLEHPRVNEAFILPLDSVDPEKRNSLGALLVLDAKGEKDLSEKGRRFMADLFREHLHEKFETVLHPKKWRYVKKIPEDSQGKREVNSIKKIFLETLEAAVTLPELLDSRTQGNHGEVQLQVPYNLHYTQGHFPEKPMVPGVIQLDWAMYFAKEKFRFSAPVQRMEAVKFHDVLSPGARFSLILDWFPEEMKLVFRLCHEQHKYASGRLFFRLGSRV